MTIEDKLTVIGESLQDIKQAIIDKGQAVTGDITTYADKISSIQSGGTEPTLITKTITTNGTYNASSDNADGYSSVSVNVAGTTPTGTLSITDNGVYDVTNYASANVSVAGGGSGDGNVLTFDTTEVEWDVDDIGGVISKVKTIKVFDTNIAHKQGGTYVIPWLLDKNGELVIDNSYVIDNRYDDDYIEFVNIVCDYGNCVKTSSLIELRFADTDDNSLYCTISI